MPSRLVYLLTEAANSRGVSGFDNRRMSTLSSDSVVLSGLPANVFETLGPWSSYTSTERRPPFFRWKKRRCGETPMKAAVYRRYGPPEAVVQVEDVEKPVPKDSEVLISVRAASVNPLDCALPKGGGRIVTGLRKPITPVKISQPVGSGLT